MSTAAHSSSEYETEPENSVAHTVAPAPVLEVVLRRVRLRALRRAAWLGHLRGRAGSELSGTLDAALQAAFDERDTPEAESIWQERAPDVQPLNDELARVEVALAGKAGAGLQQLAGIFGLSQPELDLLQACLAVAVDPTLGAVYAYLQQDSARTSPTETLAARLFDYGRRSLWTPGCPLAVWQLVKAHSIASSDPHPLTVDPVVVHWLNGELRMDGALVGLVHLMSPREPLGSWPVAEAARLIRRGLERESSVRLSIIGPASSGRQTFAAAVAVDFGLKTLSVETGDVADADWRDVFIRAQRLALLGGTALVWHGPGAQRSWPSNIAPAPLQFVALDVNETLPPCAQVIDYRVTLSGPTVDERRALWQASLPESSAWLATSLEVLAERYRLGPGDIVSVARRGPAGPREAAAFARELTRHRLGELAQLIDCPFTWRDLVVPDKLRESLEDFTFEARERATFWESPSARRLFPRGTGLVGLFSGPPGTGKTMATQVIAAALDLDLFRIDLATVVSKYIGETAKHLGRIFTRAARMNAVLLFDEADALFTKRTEVKDSHDRYANADTSYLLQLLEEYTGIIILATNRKQNIDPAFLRRVRYVCDFPRPDVAERRRIWRQVVEELTGEESLARLQPALEALAVGVQISGAQIKNVVLAAIFVARRAGEPLGMAHLLRGVERELSKEGRAMASSERERLMRDA